ncbi:MAG: hypothetical protein AAGF04_05045 [Chlamydiota bacterium]
MPKFDSEDDVPDVPEQISDCFLRLLRDFDKNRTVFSSSERYIAERISSAILLVATVVTAVVFFFFGAFFHVCSKTRKEMPVISPESVARAWNFYREQIPNLQELARALKDSLSKYETRTSQKSRSPAENFDPIAGKFDPMKESIENRCRRCQIEWELNPDCRENLQDAFCNILPSFYSLPILPDQRVPDDLVPILASYLKKDLEGKKREKQKMLCYSLVFQCCFSKQSASFVGDTSDLIRNLSDACQKKKDWEMSFIIEKAKAFATVQKGLVAETWAQKVKFDTEIQRKKDSFLQSLIDQGTYEIMAVRNDIEPRLKNVSFSGNAFCRYCIERYVQLIPQRDLAKKFRESICEKLSQNQEPINIVKSALNIPRMDLLLHLLLKCKYDDASHKQTFLQTLHSWGYRHDETWNGKITNSFQSNNGNADARLSVAPVSCQYQGDSWDKNRRTRLVNSIRINISTNMAAEAGSLYERAAFTYFMLVGYAKRMKCAGFPDAVISQVREQVLGDIWSQIISNVEGKEVISRIQDEKVST